MRDAEIRRCLRAQVEAQHRGEPDTKILDELGLRQGVVRIDLAVVNGAITGYEIKSLADTLRRLPTQVAVYGQVLDYVTIVLAECHREDACALVPDWWQIVVAVEHHDEVRLDTHRAGCANPGVDKRAVAELLWREEALDLLRVHQAERGVMTKPRRVVWDRVAEVCELDEIRRAVRDRIKVRVAQLPAP